MTTQSTVQKGWSTTDSEEIARRRQRGETEHFLIENLEPEHSCFSTFGVRSAKGVPYHVEIRSMRSLDNSCDCPDFEVNELGTCKHIEAVISHLTKYLSKKDLKTVLVQDSERTEIYLRRRDGDVEVRVAYSSNQGPAEEAHKVLDPLFSAGGKLLSHPSVGIPALRNALSFVPEEVQVEIRFSQHIQPWIDDLQRVATKDQARDAYVSDVTAGKRSSQLVNIPMHPYQYEGALHLAFNERAMLADEMGLGKTVQAIAACELLRRLRGVKSVLVVAPASLKAEWEEQITKFTNLPSLIVLGDRSTRLRQYRQHAFFYLTNYEQIRSDFAEIQSILAPDVIVLDEAQRVKNWQTKTAWAVKQLKSPYAFVLTGTPIENRIDEMYSLMQVVDSKVLGPLFRFNREFYQLDEKGRPTGYQNIDRLHKKLRPYVLRRRKMEVEEQLPPRTIKNYFVKMSQEQVKRYSEYNSKVAKLFSTAKKRPLTKKESESLQRTLACMRMLCDTPYILDENCRDCPKLDELVEILKEILTNTSNKVIVFSEWQRMLELVREALERMNMGFAWHTGTVSQGKRREEINDFKHDPDCRVFLSTDSGSTGLNLQAASVVINLDIPWNPARLEQRIARAWRKNQTKSVHVINLITEDSIEHRMLGLIAQKHTLAAGVLDGEGGLDDMPMPSGRMAIMERLQQLMGQEVVDQESIREPEVETNGFDAFAATKNDLLAHFNDRVHLVEEHVKPDGTPVLFIVVDRHNDELRGRIETIASHRHVTLPSIELLDIQTYSIIRRMTESGMLRRNDSLKRSLYRASEGVSQQRKFLDELRSVYQAAERKNKMVKVLSEAGFHFEALPAAKEAIELADRCLSLLGCPTGMIQSIRVLSQEIAKGTKSEVEAAQWLNSLSVAFIEFSELVNTALLAGGKIS